MEDFFVAFLAVVLFVDFAAFVFFAVDFVAETGFLALFAAALLFSCAVAGTIADGPDKKKNASRNTAVPSDFLP